MDKKKNSEIRNGNSFSCKKQGAIMKEYLYGGYTKAGIWKKHTGQKEEHSQLLRRMHKLVYISGENSINPTWLSRSKDQLFLTYQ